MCQSDSWIYRLSYLSIVTGFGIHFLIDDDQLYVFLIPPPGQWQRDMFYKQDPEYQAYRKAHQIYPTTSDLS